MVTKVCKNIKTKTFTGEENTPLGRGYHAEGEKIGKKMKGKNNQMYIVIKTRNGKRWQKLKTKRTNYGSMDDNCPNCLICLGDFSDRAVAYKHKKNKTIDDFGKVIQHKACCKYACKNCENPEIFRNIAMMENYTNHLHLSPDSPTRNQ